MNAGCFSQELWEEYSMGTRSEEDCTSLEEHLLICSACQDMLADADEYIQAIASAAALFVAQEDSRKRRRLSKPMAAAATLA
jgi:hypothetical protein